MREILFRGKRIDNGEWVYGCLIKVTLNGKTAHLIFGDNFSFDGNDVKALSHALVDPSTVGQYTGLTDKNGMKIFKGDIGIYKQTDGVKRNGTPIVCIGKVVYNTNTASFAVESKDEVGVKYYDYFPIKDFKVIGNIHDNPELLEEGGND